jgi:putative ABC transport system permease protein
LFAGRSFDASDNASDGRATIVVNREFVRRYLASEKDAVGREVIAHFEFQRNRPPRLIVGVVDNVKLTTLDEEPAPQVYVPISQMAYPGLTLVLRSTGDPLTMVPTVKQVVREVEPTATLTDIRSSLASGARKSACGSRLARSRVT